MKYSDGMLSRGLHPRLLLIAPDGSTILRFQGQGIPGVVSAQVTDARKNGKWSSTSWELTLAAGVVAVELIPDYETGYLLPGGSWAEAASWLSEKAGVGVSDEVLRRHLPQISARAAERLDRLEREVAGLATTPTALASAFAAASAHFAAEDERLGPAKQGETDEI